MSERLVTAPAMKVLEVVAEDPTQAALVQHDDVIQTFPTNAPDQPLDERGLPRTARRTQYFLDTHRRTAVTTGVC
jgi:hypothetical protein